MLIGSIKYFIEGRIFSFPGRLKIIFLFFALILRILTKKKLTLLILYIIHTLLHTNPVLIIRTPLLEWSQHILNVRSSHQGQPPLLSETPAKLST